MAHGCTSCGACVRPCSFLQGQGTPAQIAGRGDNPDNLRCAFGCSLCGLCDAVCPEGLSVSGLFLAMRQQAVARRLVDMKPYQPWLTYEKMGSHPLFQRDFIPGGCRTIFFPGCSLPGTRPAAVRRLYQLLTRQDPTIGLVLDCCGKNSHDLGLADRFQQIFSTLADRLRSRGITQILTACPGCSKVLRKYGTGFEVISVYEVLVAQPLEPCRPLTFNPVTVHDPCPARFDEAQQQAVRTLLRGSGYQIEELSSNGILTRCCGQGGMVEGCVPGTVARETAVISNQAGGRPVVSSCGACCETLAAQSPSAHIADLLTGTGSFTTRPVSSIRRWLNRLKLRFARL